jgi:UDP-N-acetylmuramoylalanine--D-glutamate ligase
MLNVGQQTTALEDVNYLVVGLGLSGYSAASYLLENGYRCRVQDTRDIPPYLGQLKSRFDPVEIYAGPLAEELTDWADVIVVSPGLSIRQPQLLAAVAAGKSLLGDVELFARLVTRPVVAITGSNGKSTVTTLVGAMIARDRCRVAVGGNLGTPALDLLAQQADYYVLELSSYQLETTSSLRPRVAAVLNLCEDHLDRYDDYAAYIQAKLRIYHNAGLCVSNLDDALTRHDAGDVCFSLDPLLARPRRRSLDRCRPAQGQRQAQLVQLPGGDGDRQQSRHFARRYRRRDEGFHRYPASRPVGRRYRRRRMDQRFQGD